MNTDVRISTTIQEHPKFRALRKRLGDAGALSLIFLWCFCGRSAPSGTLEDMDAADIADAAGWRGEPEHFVNTLVELRLLDKNGQTYSVHNWLRHNLFASAAPTRSRIARENIAKRWNKKTKLLQEEDSDGNTDANSDGNTPSPSRSPPPSPSPRREGGGAEDGEVGFCPEGQPSSPPEEPELDTADFVAELLHQLTGKYGNGFADEVKKLLDVGVDLNVMKYALSFVSLPDSGKLNRPPIVRLHAELRDRGVDVPPA